MKTVKINIAVVRAVKEALEDAEVFIERVNPILENYPFFTSSAAMPAKYLEKISAMKNMMQRILNETQKAGVA